VRPETDAALELVRRALTLCNILTRRSGARTCASACDPDRGTADEFSQLYCAAGGGIGRSSASQLSRPGRGPLEQRRRSIEVAALIVDQHLQLLQKRDVKDLARAAHITLRKLMPAWSLFAPWTPGQAASTTRADKADRTRCGVWSSGEASGGLNERGRPAQPAAQPALTAACWWRKHRQEVKEYVKERFRSAMQLMRNIAQRKSTILRTCEVIVRRQQDFLDQGVEALRPMMIKEVRRKSGSPVHGEPRVANKYAHTPQGVIELRFFFSEARMVRRRRHAPAGAKAQGAQAH